MQEGEKMKMIKINTETYREDTFLPGICQSSPFRFVSVDDPDPKGGGRGAIIPMPITTSEDLEEFKQAA